MLVYKLKDQIDGQKLLKSIEKLINKTLVQDREFVLVIRVQEISYNDTTSIPKLEYQPQENV